MIKNLFSRKKTLLLTVVSLLFAMFGNISVFASTAKTEMRDITALQFVNNMKVGWNLGNTFDAGNETNWGNPRTTHAMIDKIKEAGFNTIRIPVTWNMHMGSAPNYTIDSSYMSRVEEVLNYAFDNNMYVILNLHHENDWIVPTYAHQAQTTEALTKVWTQIAERFKSYGDYLIFETMNEPRPVGASNEWTGGSYENRDVINKFNLTAVNAIRNTGGNNALRFIMVPTVAASTTSVAVNDLVIPNNDIKVIVSLHMYSPYYFAMDINGTSSWGSDSDKSSLTSEFDTIYNKFVKNGRAVVIGEFGTINKNNQSSRAAHAQYFVQEARKKGITSVWWDNGYAVAGKAESYAIFDRNALNWNCPEVAKALIAGANTATIINQEISDSFEKYEGQNVNLQASYITDATGGSVSLSLSTTNKGTGSYGMKYDYNLYSGKCGVIKKLNAINATGYNAISFWLIPDSSNRNLTVQIKENSGEYWEGTMQITGTTASTVSMLFSNFKHPSWYTSGDGILDLSSLSEYSIYIGQGSGSLGTGTLYFDDITLANITPPVIKYGDINGDGKVNIIDYMLIKRYSSGLISSLPDSNGTKAADVNGDGQINSVDIDLIKQYNLRLISKFPIE